MTVTPSVAPLSNDIVRIDPLLDRYPGADGALDTVWADDPAAEGDLLTASLSGLVSRLGALTQNYSHWRRARERGSRIGDAHSMLAVVRKWERVRSAAMRQCATGSAEALSKFS